MMAAPRPLIVPAVKRHTATVIMAHGLGDSGAGWVSLAENWRRRQKLEEVKFIFPNAPNIPITVNMGMRMPGWYDIVSFDDLQGREEDEAGILKSREYLHALIKGETDAGIPSNRIILGGFSQGGAMSLFSGLTCPTQLAGVFGLSSYLVLRNKVKELIPPSNPNKDTPIFMGHGDIDQVVKTKWGVQTAELMKEWGYNVNLKMYRGLAHSATPEEIDDLEAYIKERLPPLDK